MNKKHDNCGNCRFFNPNPDNVMRGLCQRNPPQMVPISLEYAGYHPSQKGLFPEMAFEDWCGEFKANKR